LVGIFKYHLADLIDKQSANKQLFTYTFTQTFLFLQAISVLKGKGWTWAKTRVAFTA